MYKLVVRATAEALDFYVKKRDKEKVHKEIFTCFGERILEYQITPGLELLIENPDHDCQRDCLIHQELITYE
jgi:hypothetical protein